MTHLSWYILYRTNISADWWYEPFNFYKVKSIFGCTKMSHSIFSIPIVSCVALETLTLDLNWSVYMYVLRGNFMHSQPPRSHTISIYERTLAGDEITVSNDLIIFAWIDWKRQRHRLWRRRRRFGSRFLFMAQHKSAIKPQNYVNRVFGKRLL